LEKENGQNIPTKPANEYMQKSHTKKNSSLKETDIKGTLCLFVCFS
jgi:hypothetical protein